MTKEHSYSHNIGGDITWQIIAYTDLGGVAKVEQTALVRTNEENLARFLTGQLLMWQFARGTEERKESLIGYSAELRRGRREGPLDTGLWTPEHPDDPVADIAYLDADSGSIEWDLNAPGPSSRTPNSDHGPTWIPTPSLRLVRQPRRPTPLATHPCREPGSGGSRSDHERAPVTKEPKILQADP